MKKTLLAMVMIALSLLLTPAVALAHSAPQKVSPLIGCPPSYTYPTAYNTNTAGTLEVEFTKFQNEVGGICYITELRTYTQINLTRTFSTNGSVTAIIELSNGQFANHTPGVILAGHTEADVTTTFAPACGQTYYGHGEASEPGYSWSAVTDSVTIYNC